MTTLAKPAMRPARPEFSSGPCAKRPGWTPENLQNAVLGRSHRSKLGKTRLQEAIDRTRQVLEVPDDFLIGIVPGSDTGDRLSSLLHTLADAALPLGLVAVAMLLLDAATGHGGGTRLGRLVATPARRAAAVAVLAVLVALVMAAHA